MTKTVEQIGRETESRTSISLWNDKGSKAECPAVHNKRWNWSKKQITILS
jgi:hypothetical protein